MQRRADHRRERELERRRQAREDQLQHRHVEDERAAEIARDSRCRGSEILLPQRQIEAVVADRRARGCAGPRRARSARRSDCRWRRRRRNTSTEITSITTRACSSRWMMKPAMAATARSCLASWRQGSQGHCPASLSAPRVSAQAAPSSRRGEVNDACLSNPALPGARQRRFAWAARCSLCPDPDDRRPRRAGVDRPALHRDRDARRNAEARVRHAGVVRRQAPDRAAPRRELEADRPDYLGVQAAPGRQIPRRLRLHRRGREVLDRAHADRVRPEPDHDLRAPRQGDQDRRSAHDPRRHRRAGADPAERFHPPVHRVAQGGRRPDQENANEAFNSGKAAIGTGPTSFVSWTPKRAVRGRALRRLLGRQAAMAAGRAARRSRTTPPASRSSAPARST